MVENRIKERRKELGLTQEQLSEKSGISQSAISEIENGVHLPNVEEALDLAEALYTSVEKIFKKIF